MTRKQIADCPVAKKPAQEPAPSAETIHVRRAKHPSSTKWSHCLFRSLLVPALILSGALAIWADSEAIEDPALDPVERFLPNSYGDAWLTLDRDEDGQIDYAVKVDNRGYKLREAMDFNYDGKMDDFYFYANDVLQRQELDSNFDNQVDIWIYLWRGVYVRKWERDTDYDGVIDISRDYDEPRE